MSLAPLAIEEFARHVPPSLAEQNGRIFYTGRRAFSKNSPLYVLGLNPGGMPENHPNETIASHTKHILRLKNDDWSAYRDESWEGHAPGTYGMAPRVLHLFNRLDLAPGEVPCSNLVFLRSRGEAEIAGDLDKLVEACWPFHEHVIKRICPRVILCFGTRVGNFVRRKIHADKIVNTFVEQNNRGWKSLTYQADTGIQVIVATHPSRANWVSPSADPSGLVATAIEGLHNDQTVSIHRKQVIKSNPKGTTKMKMNDIAVDCSASNNCPVEIPEYKHRQVIDALNYLQSQGMLDIQLSRLHPTRCYDGSEKFNAALRYLEGERAMSSLTKTYYARVVYVYNEHRRKGIDFETLIDAAMEHFRWES